jgi:hypothetical protein
MEGRRGQGVQSSLKGFLIEGQEIGFCPGRRIGLMIRHPALDLGRRVIEEFSREFFGAQTIA